MNFLRFIEDLIRLVVLALLDLRRAGVRLILFAALAAEVLVLIICADPTFPAWSGVVIPLLERVFGAYYLHYPQSYIGLPATGAVGKLFIDLLVSPFVLAWCGMAILRVTGDEKAKRQSLFSSSVQYYAPFFLLTCLEIGVWVLFYGLPVYLLNTRFNLAYRTHAVVTIFGSLLPLLLLTPLFFVPPHLLREGKGLGRAIGSSFSRARKDPAWPLAFVALPWLASVPLSLTLQRSARLAAQLRPEIVLVAVALQAAIFLLFGFIALDAAIRIFLKPRSRGL